LVWEEGCDRFGLFYGCYNAGLADSDGFDTGEDRWAFVADHYNVFGYMGGRKFGGLFVEFTGYRIDRLGREPAVIFLR
jgi:hypothetical protein